MAKAKTRTVNKSAKDGKFVSNAFEKTHPATTFKQTVKASTTKPAKKK